MERTLAMSNLPDLQAQKRESLLKLKHPLKRLAHVAIHDFAVSYPGMAQKLVGRGLDNSGYSHAGAGHVSVVYKKDGQVIKVNQRTIRMDETSRQAIADENRREHALMRTFLNAYLTDQDIDVGFHPIKPKQRAVRVLQPFCDITDLALFTSHSPSIRLDKLVAATEAYPGVDEALSEFYEKARLMYEATGFVPDTSGTSNVVIINGGTPALTLIDGQPIGPSLPEVRANILGQLNALHAGLQEVA